LRENRRSGDAEGSGRDKQASAIDVGSVLKDTSDGGGVFRLMAI
jgi:hypothetical protein